MNDVDKMELRITVSLSRSDAEAEDREGRFSVGGHTPESKQTNKQSYIDARVWRCVIEFLNKATHAMCVQLF